MDRVYIGNITIHYELYGDGAPLLLISGLGSSSALWRPELVQALARSFRVVTFDPRGTGRSDKPEGPVTIPQLADDVACLLDALDCAPAHVFGVSFGGSVAQELALRHPASVAGLILGSTHCGAPVAVRGRRELLQPLMDPSLDPREAARRIWAVQYPPAFIEANRELLETLLERALAHPTPVATRQHQSEAAAAWNSHERLHQLGVPTLIIAGGLDPLTPPANAHILHERIRGSRVHIIEDAAHNFFNSHPEETAQTVTAFVRAAASGATSALASVHAS